MTPVDPMFSESWHRVAGQRVSLHPAVQVRRQNYRGERWYVLEHPMANQYFRIRPAAWEFVGRLRSDRSVEEVWREVLEKFPNDAPGQSAVIRLLGQLYQANLLHYAGGSDVQALSERREQREQREFRGRLANIMFFRIPLWDPDRWLVRLLPLVRPFLSWSGFLVWVFAVGWALKLLAENWGQARDGFQGVLAPGNLLWLYGSLAILKGIHELGHAFMCRKYGGEVHTLGIMFMIFTPVPYVDVTSSWSLRSRWQRIAVGAAGMWVETFIAALAVQVWTRTAPGITHSVAYNVMFVAGISTLVFNLNPLLRFDGYYILSDLLGIPNLGQRSTSHLRHLAERYLFGVKQSESPARNPSERSWLTLFGITSGIYRVVVFVGVLLAVADRYLLLGVIMFVTCIISWLFLPTGRLISYLSSSPRLERVRFRAVAVCGFLAVLGVTLLALIRIPTHFRAAGIVQAEGPGQMTVDSGGRLMAVDIPSGTTVNAGTIVARLDNPELVAERIRGQAALVEVEARLQQALADQAANLKPLRARQEALRQNLSHIEESISSLTVRARTNGQWVAPGLAAEMGRWIPRGGAIGLVLQGQPVEFRAMVLQSDADRVFRGTTPGAEVRFPGQAGRSLKVESLQLVPAETQSLPSPALGWAGGGEAPVARKDSAGQRAAEPFFEVRARLIPSDNVRLFHGQAGRIRFDLPPESILTQAGRRFWQLLQQRYQL